MQQIKREILNQEKYKSYYGYSEPKEYNVGFIPHKSGKYIIEIDSEIETVSQFSTAIQCLNVAKEEDEIEIHLQCNGGNVDAGGAFIHAIRKCPANIHIIATGGNHSYATHILLEADTFELSENFNSLIHNGGSGAIGNINEYHAKSDFDKKFIRDGFFSCYEGFLSNDEIEGVLRGDNIWLDAEAWVQRHDARNEYFKAKAEVYMKANMLVNENTTPEQELMFIEEVAPTPKRKPRAIKK
jgi:ATP-dependent protease ClpP protease subunit